MEIKTENRQRTRDGTGAKITLRWIKAHVGFDGNELAGNLAKKGSMNQGDFGLTTPVPHSYTKSQNKSYVLRLWNTRWLNLPTCRQTKSWFPEVNLGASKTLLTENRISYSRAIRWITGHNFLRRHRYVVNQDDPALTSIKC